VERIIYLDNSATTKPCKTALEYMNKALIECWGNPSSLHTLGIESEMLVTEARSAAAKAISAREDEIIFTGSGTEANNTAILSAISRIKTGNKIITSKIEHPSVLETVKRLESFGFEIAYVGCNSEGIVDLNELETLLDSKTVLVSIMLVNNEIGTVQPISEISKLIRKNSPNAFFHCDAVQAFGKIQINVKTLGVDLLTVSGHKIHGPKGVGFLYCKKGLKLNPLISGGGQERGLRSGTEPVPVIAGMYGAIKSMGDLKKQYDYIKEINSYARENFKNSGIIEINSPENALPYILNIAVTGYRSETLLHFLEQKNIFVSSGSACAKGKPSYVLEAVGITAKRADSSLRLSFSKDNTKEDIEFTLSALKEATNKLRRS